MSVHSSLLFMLLFMRVTAGDAEDHSVQLQVTSCSAEINTPTLQRSFNAALDKSVANYESIKKVNNIVRMYSTCMKIILNSAG